LQSALVHWVWRSVPSTDAGAGIATYRAGNGVNTYGVFRLRDVVRVRNSAFHHEVAGTLGTVVGGTRTGESVAVRIDDLHEVYSISPGDLEATGQRVQPQLSRVATSLHVNQAGDVLRSEDYEVLEDVAVLWSLQLATPPNQRLDPTWCRERLAPGHRRLHGRLVAATLFWPPAIR
jgi:hypothetical protein